MELLNTMWVLVMNLATLGQELFLLAASWSLLIVWIAWWLWAVNWKKAWPVLRSGSWVPLVLLMVIAALVWSRITPRCDCPFFKDLPVFWSQLVGVSLIVGVALVCGWLQIYFQWSPAEISLEPPVHGHDHGNGHDAHASGHGSEPAHSAHHH